MIHWLWLVPAIAVGFVGGMALATVAIRSALNSGLRGEVRYRR